MTLQFTSDPHLLDNYHVSFPHDSRISKAIVYVLYCIELAQTLIMTRDCFTSYAAGFGDLRALDAAQTEWLASPILIGVGRLFPPQLPSRLKFTHDSQLFGTDVLLLSGLRALEIQDPPRRHLHGMLVAARALIVDDLCRIGRASPRLECDCTRYPGPQDW